MIAIVIPYYNPYFFEVTLRSLVAQTDQRFRVYIGDDCSPHAPASVLKLFEGQLNFHYHRFESNLGQQSLVQHWRRCITLTKEEEWLMLLGDDDVLGPEVVASFYKNQEDIHSSGVSVVRYASVVINAEGVETSKVYIHPELELATEAYYKVFRNESRSSLSEYMFKRRAYEACGFRDYPLGWYSDTMAWLEFSAFGYLFSINSSVVSVRKSVYSITGTGTNYLQKYQSGYRFYKDVLSLKPKRFIDAQRYDFILALQGLVFKLGFLDVANWLLIVHFWLKGLYLKQALRFTIIFLKRTFTYG